MKSLSAVIKNIFIFVISFSFCLPGLAQSGIKLAKEAQIVSSDINGNINIRLIYRVENSGADTLYTVHLEDDIKFAYRNVATISFVSRTLSSTLGASTKLTLNTSHTGGSENIFATGTGIYIQPGETATITIIYNIKLNTNYPQNGIQGFTAYVSAKNRNNIFVDAESINGSTPGGGNGAPGVVTPINIAMITITGLPQRTEAESDAKLMEFIIERRGYKAETTNLVATFAGTTYGSNTLPATLGTAAGSGIDAYSSFLTYNLTFNNGEDIKTLEMQIVDDDVYELKEVFSLTLTGQASNISLNQRIVYTTINSEEPKPTITLSDLTGQNKYTEGTSNPPAGTPVTVKATLSYPHYKNLTVPVALVFGSGTTMADAADFNGATSGSFTFNSQATESTFTFNIKQDDIEEEQEQFSVKATVNSTDLSDIGKSSLTYYIRDDDKRLIQWIGKAPESKFKELHKGTGIKDTVEIDFFIAEGNFRIPRLEITMPAGVQYEGDFQNLAADNRIDFKYDSKSGNTYYFVPVSATELIANQRVRFKFTKTALCSATQGTKEDIVKLRHTLLSGTNLYAKDLITSKTEQRYSYMVKEGNLVMQLTKGETLIFPSETDNSKPQEIKVQNTGLGVITSQDLAIEIEFDQKIIEKLDNLTINGIPATYATSTPYQKFTVTITDAILQTIGNKDKLFDPNENIIISYDVITRSKADLKGTNLNCGLKKETIRSYWACKKPAQTLTVGVEIYRPAGKPVLDLQIIKPTTFTEDGSPNNFIIKLTNTGTSDAFNVAVPMTIRTADTSLEWIIPNEVTVQIDGGPVYTVSASGSRASSVSFNFSNISTGLYIPVGKTAEIIYPIRRDVVNRYSSLTNDTEPDVLTNKYFSYLYLGNITYTDECQEAGKAGRLGDYFINGSGNVAAFAPLSVRNTNLIDMSDDPGVNLPGSYTMEFGDYFHVFPMHETNNWFDGELEINLYMESNVPLTAPDMQFDGIVLTGNDGSQLKWVLGDLNSSITVFRVDASDIETPQPNVPGIGDPRQNRWRIKIQNLDKKYLSKNAKIELKVMGVCTDNKTKINKVHYTVNYKTKNGVLHKVYKARTSTTVKCTNEPGVNLKRYFSQRINVTKGDQNDNGIDNGGKIGSGGDTDTTGLSKKIRFDRLYDLDTIIFKTSSRLMEYPADPTKWKHLHIVLSDKNRKMDATNFIHQETKIKLYQKITGTYFEYLNHTITGAGSVQYQPNYNGSNHLGLHWDPGTPAYLFGAYDSIAIESVWTTRVETGVTGSARTQETSNYKFWTYVHDVERTNWYDDFPVGTDPNMPIAQMDAYFVGEMDRYTIGYTTNSVPIHQMLSPQYTTAQNASYSHLLTIGTYGWNNTTFTNELRQPYYVNDVKFTLPYGYVLEGDMKFLNIGSTKENGIYKHNFVKEFLNGNKQTAVTLTNYWDTDIKEIHNTSKDQIADEGWSSNAYIPIKVTPRAPIGLSSVSVDLSYASPPDAGLDPFNQSVSFYLNNNAANFLVEYFDKEAYAYNDTVRWTVRVTNPSSVEDVMNCWLYLEGDGSLKPLYVVDHNNNIVTTPNKGYQGRWIKVADKLLKSSAQYYTIVARYDPYVCDRDSLVVTPWFNQTTDPMNYTLNGTANYYQSNPLDTTTNINSPTYDLWVGITQSIYINQFESAINGMVTQLMDTPKKPEAPVTGGKYDKDEISLGNDFPVEIILNTTDMIGVKDVNIDISIPKGLKYVENSGYYQWKGDTLKFETTAETKMLGFDGDVNTPGDVERTINITLKDFINRDTIPGIYNTEFDDRTVFLRFLLNPQCQGFDADSASINVQMHANRLCGTPAYGDQDTITGGQIYLEGFRYYKLDQDLYPPAGPDFALCNNQDKGTLTARLYRIGAGALQNDSIVLKLPKQFTLDLTANPGNSIRYDKLNTDPTDAGTPWDMDGEPIKYNLITDDPDSTIIKWAVPRKYSENYKKNIRIEYEIDIKVDQNNFQPSDYKYDQVATIYVVSGDNPTCTGSNSVAGEVLSKEKLHLYIHTNLIGLAKENTWVIDPAKPSDFIVTTTYTIHNYSSSYLNSIMLRDELYQMYNGQVDLDSFKIKINTPLTLPSEIEIDSLYIGGGNLVQSGMLAGGETAVIEMTYRATPNLSYTGVKFKNNASISAYNHLVCQTTDISTWPLATVPDAEKPDNSREPDNLHTIVTNEPSDTSPTDYNDDGDPNNNDVQTPVQFSSIRFKDYVTQPPTYPKISEDVGTLSIIVERVGDLSGSVDVGFGTDKSYLSKILPRDSLATLGTSPDCGVDAWKANLIETIPQSSWTPVSGSQTMAEAVVSINIVDDNIFEWDEAFYAYLFNAPPLVSLINDTVTVEIAVSDRMPTINMVAVQDSIKEGTIIQGPGHNYGCTPLLFKVSLTNPSYQEIKADWQSIGGGNGTDPLAGYNYKTGSLSFQNSCLATDTVQFIEICVIADSIPEPSKLAQAELISSSITTALWGKMKASTMIVDDDIKIDTLALRSLQCKNDASGKIVIVARGGETGASAGKYHYRWTGPNGFTSSNFTSGNDSIQNLQAGIYTVTITDVWSNPTSVSYSIEVIEPTLSLSIAIDNIKNVTCNNGSDGAISTTISGGWDSPNYVINWSKEGDSYTANTDDITGLFPGVYIIVANDSALCTATDTVTITQPLPLAISGSAIGHVICKGNSNGKIGITVNNGNPFPTPNDPYLIHWTGPNGYTNSSNRSDISGLFTGEYVVTIQDNGCETLKDTFLVKEPLLGLAVSIDSILNVACKEDATGAIYLKTEGGWGENTYTWDDGMVFDIPEREGLIAKTYSVIVADSAGCTLIVSPIIVSEPNEKMVVTIAATDETYQNGNDGTITVMVAGGIPNYNYLWNDDPTLNTNYRNHLHANTYTITVTDQWNCSIVNTVVIDEPLVVDDLPNVFTPDNDGFNDRLLENFHIKVFDRWGLLLYDGTDGWDGRYKGKMMPAGTYFYVLIDDTTGKEYKSSVLLQIVK
ncbi:MAG: gliding motility-associated C-terminal domain-containing protein [Bacteroidales bacterium]|jgi:gliding motility-associated-like protein|nr:gliding motility-associated C-terminal domain-containing protein [Bacteroidales bacterium]